MKTVKEKIQTFCDENGLEVAAFEFSLLRLIKEQDRDTRHACADKLITLAKYGDDKDYIKTDEATAACINARLI